LGLLSFGGFVLFCDKYIKNGWVLTSWVSTRGMSYIRLYEKIKIEETARRMEGIMKGG